MTLGRTLLRKHVEAQEKRSIVPCTPISSKTHLNCKPMRSYENAVALLESRRRVNSKRWEAEMNLVPGADRSVPSGKPGLEGMREWLRQLGYLDTNLNIIHVAGTKGKCGTCAFVECFLREHGKRTGFPKKTGLYTSPPLVSIRERIRINAKKISKELFTSSFFEIWEKLLPHPCPTPDKLENMPRYRQFLMLLSFHIFARQGVDVAIYETHSGGEYDYTNIIKPTVTGITTIGMDHVRLLGPTLENIAWHKAGIFKPGRPAFSSPQEPTVASMLRRRAAEKTVPLEFVHVDPCLPEAPLLEPEVQKINASLALSLTRAFLNEKEHAEHGNLTSQDIIHGVEQYSWPGRFYQIVDGKFQWYLDIAHNEMSLRVATQWFAEMTSRIQSNSSPSERILVFSHKSDRDSTALLTAIVSFLQERRIQLQHVIFTTFSEGDGGATTGELQHEQVPLITQQGYSQIWESLDPVAQISIEPTVERALNLARKFGAGGNGIQILITGSAQLIGPALCLLEPGYSDVVQKRFA